MFFDEKVRSEAALMKYIARETNIPVPRVIGYQMATENLAWDLLYGTKMSDLFTKKAISATKMRF